MTSGPRAFTHAAAVVAGVVAGVLASMLHADLSSSAGPELIGGSNVPVRDDEENPAQVTVDLSVANHGAAAFQLADVTIPGWVVVEPGVVSAIAPGEWTQLSLDLVADCSAGRLVPHVELVGADGETIMLDSEVDELALLQERACLPRDDVPSGALPVVSGVQSASGGRVLHVDIDVEHPGEAELGLSLAAVTGHASGFSVELPDRLTTLDAGATTSIRTDWRVRDCGGAAGTTGSGAPDRSSSGSFQGLTLHLYWDDPEQSPPLRTDLAVDLPTDVIVALARMAVTVCHADGES